MTVTEVSFFVYGLPAAQGSKRHVGKGIMVETSKNLPSWRAAVIEYAQKAYAGPPLDGALELTVTFWFPRPKSAKKGARWKTTAPDVDKLARAVGDALKIAGTIVDDARIVRLVVEKRHLLLPQGTAFSGIGADVTVALLDNGGAK
jgi:Holliday junction resolvase RusA-like endonuclease